MKLVRKAIVGIGTVALTAISLTTSTYAWFKINSKAEIQGVNLSVHGGEGFMVSVDGINYKNDLTYEDITSAILIKYQPDRFGFKYDKSSGTSTLYNISVAYDNSSPDEPIRNVTYDSIVTDEQKLEALSKIELIPITSKDGINMEDLYKASATSTSGRFYEFSTYFKTKSGNYYKSNVYDSSATYYEINNDGVMVPTTKTISENNCTYFYLYKLAGEYISATKYDPGRHYYRLLDDGSYRDVTSAVNVDNYANYYVYTGMRYDIYLNGEEQISDQKYGEEVISISPTKFISSKIEENVSANMTIVENLKGVLTPRTLKTSTYEKFSVYPANALRLSITDEANASNEGVSTNIYELNDYVNGSANYGSYATTYSDLYFTGDPDYSIDLDYMHGYQYNAMYTYYSNLKDSTKTLQKSQLYSKLMTLDEMPTTIKNLTDKDSVTGEYTYNKKITSLLSGAEDGTLITFRIWLEGWDADCFDGLKGSISASLSFTSKRIY